MKKFKKTYHGFTILAMMLFVLISINGFGKEPKQQYFEIRIYHVMQPSQAERIDNYLKSAYIPALHKAGIGKTGVFKPVESDTAYGKLIYVFIPLKDGEQYLKLPSQLQKDEDYQKTSKDFVDAPYNDPPFTRYESILLIAFAGMPEFMAPVFDTPYSERIYELRSYESATDFKASKKIEMFNSGGEIKLFKSLDFNAVFYGEVLVGSHKPNLMYMITFRDNADHDSKWQTFVNSPGWKELSGLEQYKNTVSKANVYLLHPTSYSEF